MSAAVGEALLEAVRGPEPTDAGDMVRAFGGPPAVARAIVGQPLDRRPRDMTPDVRRRYENAKRQVQRWVTTAGERRQGGFSRLSPQVRRRLIEAGWRAQERRRWAELGAGARTRLHGAEVTDETPQAGRRPRTRRRTLPAQGTPGKYLPPRVVADLRAYLLDDDPPNIDDAGNAYVAAFFTEGDDYVWDFEPEVLSVDSLSIWPEGGDEDAW